MFWLILFYVVYFGWLFYEAKHAPEMPENLEDLL